MQNCMSIPRTALWLDATFCCPTLSDSMGKLSQSSDRVKWLLTSLLKLFQWAHQWIHTNDKLLKWNKIIQKIRKKREYYVCFIHATHLFDIVSNMSWTYAFNVMHIYVLYQMNYNMHINILQINFSIFFFRMNTYTHENILPKSPRAGPHFILL